MFDRLARYAVALLLMAFVAMPARADDVAGFYKGRQLKLIIGSEPGSEHSRRQLLPVADNPHRGLFAFFRAGQSCRLPRASYP